MTNAKKNSVCISFRWIVWNYVQRADKWSRFFFASLAAWFQQKHSILPFAYTKNLTHTPYFESVFFFLPIVRRLNETVETKNWSNRIPKPKCGSCIAFVALFSWTKKNRIRSGVVVPIWILVSFRLQNFIQIFNLHIITGSFFSCRPIKQFINAFFDHFIYGFYVVFAGLALASSRAKNQFCFCFPFRSVHFHCFRPSLVFFTIFRFFVVLFYFVYFVRCRRFRRRNRLISPFLRFHYFYFCIFEFSVSVDIGRMSVFLSARK